MATNKKRINISIPDSVQKALSKLAYRDQVPQATKAAELLRTALEYEEDVVLDALATKREKKKAGFVSHDNAWA